MNVQIVVPAINLWRSYSKPCLESIMIAMMRAKSHNISSRLLFIDNGSIDETKEEASKMVSDLFSHKRNEESWGFQKSVNFGVDDAIERGFKYILVCNNDILLHPEAIWRLVERFEKGDVAMVTCMDVRGETSPSLFDSMNPKQKEEVEESEHPNFSAFMLSEDTWKSVGGFDEVFAPAYFEDNDYHYRINISGQKAIVLPTALFYHFASRTNMESGPVPVVSNQMFEKNRATYVQKWGGLPGQETYKVPYNKE